MKWRRRQLSRQRLQARKREQIVAETRRIEKLAECWLPKLVGIGEGPNPCVDIRARAWSNSDPGIPLREQTDFAVAMLISRREINFDGFTIRRIGQKMPLQVTDLIRKLAATEWLRRYPQGVKSSKWWVPSFGSVRLIAA